MIWTAHLCDVAHVFESTLEAEVRVRRVLELTSRLLPCDRIALFDRRATLSPSLLIIPDITPDERPALAQRITELADLLHDDAVHHRRVVEVPDSAAGNAHLAVPLVGANDVIGVIFVESAAAGYEPKHLELLSAVAGQIAAYLTLLRCERTFVRRSSQSTSTIAQLERAISLRDGVLGRLAGVLRGPLDAAVLARVADQLDDLDSIRAGTDLALERRPVDLARICRHVIEEQQASHPTCTIGFATMGDPSCTGDPRRLSQVVRELVSNAIRHGEPGAPLGVTVDGMGSDVVIQSHNEGAIAKERIAAIFDPPPRDAQPREPPPGLGLGLFVAHRIVADHGGAMEIVSSEEKGTTVVIRLPRRTPS